MNPRIQDLITPQGSGNHIKNRYASGMKLLRSVAVVTLFSLLGACSGPEGQQADVNTLQRGLSSDPETLDPHKARSTQAADVLRDLGEIMPEPLPGHGQRMLEVWEKNWAGIGKDQAAVDRVEAAIDATREAILQVLRALR